MAKTSVRLSVNANRVCEKHPPEFSPLGYLQTEDYSPTETNPPKVN